MAPLTLTLGVKTDPIEYRYSYEWLFDLLAETGVHDVQLGTFFEIYHLPDEYFLRLRQAAASRGIRIASVFTAHRELGGFFRADPAWENVARRSFERLIEVGSLVGAQSVGSNPGAVMRDQLRQKPATIACYLRHMRELLHVAHRAGVPVLGLEPMSCLAEPPTLPDEMRAMVEALWAYHRQHPDDTSTAGLCTDVSHGYADAQGRVVFSNLDLLEAALPYTTEVHLKNTDALFSSTFGFGPAERARGIVDVADVRARILASADKVPCRDLICYLEIGGPKLGRDYSDPLLAEQLRESLEYLRPLIPPGPPQPPPAPISPRPGPVEVAAWPEVTVSASIMCARPERLEEDVRRLEAAGCDWLHFDIMDGHFVPNLPLGLEVVRALRPLSKLPFDVHLMVADNDFFVERLGPLGVQYISVHVESATHLDRTLQLIRSFGARAGVALNPATPLAALDYVLEQADFVVLMTVNPGYAGQKLVPGGLRKIEEARRYLRARGANLPIQVDGNVSFEYIPRMVAAGADSLVAGTSSVFHPGGTPRRNLQRVRECISQGHAARRCPGG